MRSAGSETDGPGDGVSASINASSEELLDLGMRNPLLSYRPSRARGVEVVDEVPAEVFGTLVGERKPMTFQAAPEREDEGSAGGVGSLAQPGDGNGGLPDRHTDSRLQTSLTSARLQTRLVKTERDARTFVEEQGVNTLYLALGMLRWFESDGGGEARRAPLVLVPVELERSSVRERFRLRYTEEDLGNNLSLRSKLRQEYAIELPGLPAREDLHLDGYFDLVEEAVGGRGRWSVDRDAVVLGFFSFGKLLMYLDLDEEEWPEGRAPSEHGIIRSLFGGETFEGSDQLSEDEHLDRHLDPAEVRQVVEADSSQTLALFDVKGGRNLVIQGPPGTGKSQTITNVIAEVVAEGKTVLFVAEKMAALEVVKRRLDSVGLGEACLELHSRKTNKRAVLQELSRTMNLGPPRLREAEDDLNALAGARDRLNAYSEAVNAPIGESGSTPYRAIGELVRLGRQAAESPRLDAEAMRGWTGADFGRHQERVRELQALISRTGTPSRNPFYGSTRTSLLPTEQGAVRQEIRTAHLAIRALREAGARLAGALRLPDPETREEVEALCRAGRRVAGAPPLDGVRLRSGEWGTRREDLRSLVTAGEAYVLLRERYDGTLIPEAWSQDLLETRQHLANHADKWWRNLSGDYRKARNRLGGLCREGPPKDPEGQLALADAVLEARRHREVFDAFEPLGRDLFGGRWRGERSDWPALRGLLEWTIELHSDVTGNELPAEVIDFLADEPEVEGLEQRISGTQDALRDHASSLETVLDRLQPRDDTRSAIRAEPLAAQESASGTWDRRFDELQSLVAFNALSGRCREEGLADAPRRAESWEGAGGGLADAFRYTWFEGLVERAFRERPALAQFDRENHEYVAGRFRELDKLVLEHNRVRLAHLHWQEAPTGRDAGGQIGVLRREMQKKRRHLPVRQLLNQAGNAVQALKPVFMMSPLSIANFLEPGVLDFDLVVFDEASQVRPVEALGAIARGKQAVVVGDSKQLPPTSFFDRLMNAEEIDEDNVTADLESVLGLFVAQGAPERMLRWHYRSRHDSLIAVSNNEFYENRLVVFPSPDRGRDDAGLILHHLPDTVYDRGGTRSNSGEARRVAEAVMSHAKRRPDETLGVAAFSSAQTQAVEDQLEILRRTDPSCEGFFAAHPYEPFFVKNLENVQGDERDAIFISVGYGRTDTGSVPMNFGPLNRDGGERRLNVLITRARRRCEVFTNMTSEDMDLGRAGSRGVRALKTFLRYAEGGGLDAPVPTGREPDSPFEEAVLRALHGAGYRVETQVGSAGFFVDLAVVDPDKPGRYALGIECDGATYHSARSARDRDRLRQEVLEGLGWRIHRIWSTDWFRNPERELARAVEAVEEARAARGVGQEARPSTAGEGSNIERDEKIVPAGSSDAPPYERSNLRISVNGGELHQADPDSLAGILARIVEVESPIHVQEVSRRITEAAHLSRAGSRIRAVIEAATRSAERRRTVVRRGDFLWHPGMEEAPVRNRSNLPDGSRKLEFVAPEELTAAVERAVASSYGIGRKDVAPAALRLLGFGRSTKTAQGKMERAAETAVSQGRVIQRGDQLLPKQSPEDRTEKAK